MCQSSLHALSSVVADKIAECSTTLVDKFPGEELDTSPSSEGNTSPQARSMEEINDVLTCVAGPRGIEV